MRHGTGNVKAMSKKRGLKRGDKVSWNSRQGEISGTVEKKLTGEMEIEGHHVAASPDDPEYLVKSDRTGAVAAHKPDALRTST